MRRKSRKSKHDDLENNVSDNTENNSNGSENLTEENNEDHENSEPEQKRRKSDKRVSFSSKKAAKESKEVKESKEAKDVKDVKEPKERESKDSKDVDNGDAQYEVESIVDEKTVKGVKHYLIRWKGYDSDGDTWEPEDTVNCGDLIKQFNANRKNYTDSKSKKFKSPKKKPSKKEKDVEDWDENEEFEIERIIEVHHRRDNKREFYVSWKGYPQSQNSWVLEEDMTCSDLIAKFMSKVEKAREVEHKDLRVKRSHTDRFTLATFDTGRRLSRRNIGKQRVQYHDAE